MHCKLLWINMSANARLKTASDRHTGFSKIMSQIHPHYSLYCVFVICTIILFHRVKEEWIRRRGVVTPPIAGAGPSLLFWSSAIVQDS